MSRQKVLWNRTILPNYMGKSYFNVGKGNHLGKKVTILEFPVIYVLFPMNTLPSPDD